MRRLSVTLIIARSMNRLSMREGCSSASHKPVAGIGVELQRDGAEMQVEIDQRGAFLALLGEDPGDGDRRGRRADAAAAAEKGDHLAEPAAVPPPPVFFSNSAVSCSRPGGLTR